MKKLLIITMTPWSEAPRLRHQVTNLLKDNGYAITYIEHTKKGFSIKKRKEEGISFLNIPYPIPYELLPNKQLVSINYAFIKRKMKLLLEFDSFDAVINFNYNFPYLRDLFPKKKIITIINDNFHERGYAWTRQLRKSQTEETCSISDTVLGVSYPIIDYLKAFNQDTSLFLPWFDGEYKRPKEVKNQRNVVLFYGFINYRIDWDVIEHLGKSNIQLRFIGPKNNRDLDFNRINQIPNLTFLPPCGWDELELDDVCCSILPWETSLPQIQAITMNNKGFRLLAKGIPLLYPNLSGLIKAPEKVIGTYDTKEEAVEKIHFFQENFYKVQDLVINFLSNHTAQERLKSLEYQLNK